MRRSRGLYSTAGKPVAFTNSNTSLSNTTTATGPKTPPSHGSSPVVSLSLRICERATKPGARRRRQASTAAWRGHPRAAGTRAAAEAGRAAPPSSTAAAGSATRPALGPASGRAAAREAVPPSWRASFSVAAGPVAVRAPPARGWRRARLSPPYVALVKASGAAPPARRLRRTTRRHAVAGLAAASAAVAPATGASAHVRLGLLGGEL